MSPLPFALPRLGAGFAALRPCARALGDRLAGRAGEALAAQLGVPVSIEGRPLPALPAPSAGVARLGIALEALPGEAVLEVEASLAARLVDRLAGGDGAGPAALSLTPVERSALELLCLVALAAIADDPEGGGLSPRLAAEPGDPSGPLAVELAVGAGPVRGRCRLLVPARALPAPGGAPRLRPPASAWRVDGWVVSGRARLGADELASLAPGDVLVLDEPPSPAIRVRLPGAWLAGRRDDDRFILEDPVTPPAADLTLDLSVEIARVSLSLAELAELAPGGAVPLHVPADGRVLLRLGDRPVARGELVDIEGALGVRIERLEVSP